MDPNVYTDSDGFKIRGDFLVGQPNSGTEIWEVNTNKVVSWTTTGTINYVDLLYSTDNFIILIFVKTTPCINTPISYQLPLFYASWHHVAIDIRIWTVKAFSIIMNRQA